MAMTNTGVRKTRAQIHESMVLSMKIAIVEKIRPAIVMMAMAIIPMNIQPMSRKDFSSRNIAIRIKIIIPAKARAHDVIVIFMVFAGRFVAWH